MAASEGHQETCEVLIDNDSPLNPTDVLNQTPLHLACENGHEDVVEVLLKSGADVTIKHRNGFNCLDFALDNGKWDCALAIINSEYWEDALRSKIQDKKGRIMTPLRRMIKEMPDMAVKVFTKCITEVPVSGPEEVQTYTFNFEFIDDSFTAALWDDGQKDDLRSQKDGLSTVDAVSVHSGKTEFSDDQDTKVLFDFEGKLIDKLRSYDYCKNPDVVAENHPLILLVKEKQAQLLEHPLTLALLSYKWKSYGRSFYFINLAIYIIFLFFFNFFMIAIPAPYVMSTYNQPGGGCNRTISVLQPETSYPLWRNNKNAYESIRVIGYIAMILGLFRQGLELIQLYGGPIKYFKSITNWFESGTYIGCFLVVLELNDEARECGLRQDWQWQVGVISLVISWIVLLLFIRKFPRFGIYVVMFTNITKTMFDFLLVFMFFLLAFAFGFHVSFANRASFGTWWRAIIKTLVLMIGEYDFESLFYPDDESFYENRTNYEAISYVIFVVFVFCIGGWFFDVHLGDDVTTPRRP